MNQDEIQEEVKAIEKWDSQERRRLLKEQSERKYERLRPLWAACAKVGHEVHRTGVRNILGEAFLGCKRCGAHMGIEE